jgi:hypothetical protein
MGVGHQAVKLWPRFFCAADTALCERIFAAKPKITKEKPRLAPGRDTTIVIGQKYHITSFLARVGEPNESLIRKLNLLWGGESVQKEFRARVLEYLARIKKSRSIKDKRDSVRPATAALVKKLRRRAKRVRRLADDLGKPLGGQVFPLFPAREMQLYADRLDDSAARLLRGGAYAPSLDVSVKSKRPPRRKRAPETEQIVELVEFVQKRTGQKHWRELTTLLQCATGDSGYSNHRLQALCHSYWKKRKAARPAPGRFRI